MKLDKFMMFLFSKKENLMAMTKEEERLEAEKGSSSFYINVSDIKLISYIFDFDGVRQGRSLMCFRKGMPFKSLIVFGNPEDVFKNINNKLRERS